MSGALILISRVLYTLATLTLLALAFGFICYAGWNIFQTITGETPLLSAMLSAVGLIIIALAVSDVGRFLLQEELAGEKELETTSEVRRTISKFITIIIIAASLEAIVFIFKAGREQIETLTYPVLLLTAVALLLGVLGFYQRMTHAAEHQRRVDADEGLPDDPEQDENQSTA